MIILNIFLGKKSLFFHYIYYIYYLKIIIFIIIFRYVMLIFILINFAFILNFYLKEIIISFIYEINKNEIKAIFKSN